MDEVNDPAPAVGWAEASVDGTGVVVLKLSGEIDMANVDALRAEIEPALEPRPKRVIFDLGRLNFMDSSGIALLLQVAARAESVRVREPSVAVRRMIEVTGLADVLHIDP